MDVYVLRDGAGDIILIADDIELCNERMANYSAADQIPMHIENHDLIQAGG